MNERIAKELRRLEMPGLSYKEIKKSYMAMDEKNRRAYLSILREHKSRK